MQAASLGQALGPATLCAHGRRPLGDKSLHRGERDAPARAQLRLDALLGVLGDSVPLPLASDTLGSTGDNEGETWAPVWPSTAAVPLGGGSLPQGLVAAQTKDVDVKLARLP